MDCQLCGIEFTKLNSRSKFCSGKCKNKSKYLVYRVKFKEDTGFSRQSIRGLVRKLKLIEENGGGCSKCGYNTNISCLEFHHINPLDKKLELDMRTLSNMSSILIEEEVKKCIILCSNCHQSYHHPQLNIENLKEKILKINIDFGFTTP